MQWLNINVSELVSEEFLGASPVERATWLCLLRYCVVQENGGTIVSCGSWGDRKWQQLCGITLEEAKTESKLWTWWGEGSVNVWKYPMEAQENCQRLRGQSKKAARKRWAKQELNGHSPPKPRKRTYEL